MLLTGPPVVEVQYLPNTAGVRSVFRGLVVLKMRCSSISSWIIAGCLLSSVFADNAEELDYSWATPTNGSLSDRSQVSFSCLTPRYQPGNCVNINDCPELVQVLHQRPLSPKAKQFLQLSVCFYYQNEPPVVCCVQPNQRNSQQVKPTSRPTGVPPTPRPTSRPAPRPEPNRNGNTGGTTAIDHPNARLIPEQCGTESQSRIFGGTETQLGEFAWMALLKYRQGNRDGFYCGGVLINDRYVLTASHCVKIDGVRMIAVRVGEHNVNTDPDCVPVEATGQNVCAPAVQEIAVEEEIPHPEYSKNDRHHYNDIALVRLRSPAQFNDYVQPICLPFGAVGRANYVNKKLWVAGWGKTEKRSESDIKLKVGVSVTGLDQCAAVYRQNLNINYERQICAGGETGRDSCNGDSGGPLMGLSQENGQPRWYSIGVVAFGPSQCGMKGWPGVYTRTTNYIDWILSTIRD